MSMVRIENNMHYMICKKIRFEEGLGEVETRYYFNAEHKKKTIISDHYLHHGKLDGEDLFKVLTKNEIELLIEDITKNKKDYKFRWCSKDWSIKEFLFYPELEKALEDSI